MERPEWAMQTTDPYELNCDICQNALGKCHSVRIVPEASAWNAGQGLLFGRMQPQFHMYCLMRTLLPTVCRRPQSPPMTWNYHVLCVVKVWHGAYINCGAATLFCQEELQRRDWRLKTL